VSRKNNPTNAKNDTTRRLHDFLKVFIVPLKLFWGLFYGGKQPVFLKPVDPISRQSTGGWQANATIPASASLHKANSSISNGWWRNQTASIL